MLRSLATLLALLSAAIAVPVGLTDADPNIQLDASWSSDAEDGEVHELNRPPPPSPSPPAARPIRSCTMATGDGTGGSESRISGTYSTAAACSAAVQRASPNANGATYSARGTGACYAETGMTGRNTNSAWQSCIFGASGGGGSSGPAPSPAAFITRFPPPAATVRASPPPPRVVGPAYTDMTLTSFLPRELSSLIGAGALPGLGGLGLSGGGRATSTSTGQAIAGTVTLSIGDANSPAFRATGRVEARMDCTNGARGCRVSRIGHDSIATFSAQVSGALNRPFGIPISTGNHALNLTVAMFPDGASRNAWAFLTYSMPNLNAYNIISGFVGQSSTLQALLSWIPTLTNPRLTLAVGTSQSPPAPFAGTGSKSITAFHGSCLNCLHSVTALGRPSQVPEWAARTGMRRFPDLQGLLSDGVYARAAVVFSASSAFGLMLCLIPNLLGQGAAACTARRTVEMELFMPLEGDSIMARLEGTYVKATLAGLGPFPTPSPIRQIGTQVIQFTGFSPSSQALQLNVNNIEFQLPTSISCSGGSCSPTQWTFRFTVSLQANYVRSTGPPCGVDQRFQAGVIIPQQGPGLRIPFAAGDQRLHVGGSFSMVNLICGAVPTPAGQVVGAFAFGSQTFTIGIQIPLPPNPVTLPRAFGLYVAKNQVSLADIFSAFCAVAGLRNIAAPRCFTQFSMDNLEVCLAPGANIQFYTPDYQPGAACSMGISGDVSITVLSLTARGRVSASMSRSGSALSFGQIDASIAIAGIHSAITSLVNAVRNLLNSIVPSGILRAIANIFTGAINALLSAVQLNSVSVTVAMSLALPGPPTPAMSVRIIGRFGGRTVDFATPSLSAGFAGFLDILRLIPVRRLASMIGLNIPSRVCLPRACTRVPIPRVCAPRICAPRVCPCFGGCCVGGGCVGGGCIGGGSSNVCVPPVEICINSPFMEESFTQKRIQLYGKREERGLEPVGEEFYNNPEHVDQLTGEPLFNETAYYGQYDEEIANPPNSEKLATDTQAWAATMKTLFDDEGALALNFPEFAAMVAHNQTHHADIVSSLGNDVMPTDAAAHAAANSNPPAVDGNEKLDDLELMRALVSVMGVGMDHHFDAYAHPDGGYYDESLAAHREAHDAEFADVIQQVMAISEKLNYAANGGVTQAAWQAGKRDVHDHVKDYVLRKTSALADKYAQLHATAMAAQSEQA